MGRPSVARRWLFVQVHQESNLRAAGRTGDAGFAVRYRVAGPDAVAAPPAGSMPWAFIQAARDGGDWVLGVLAASAPPGPPVEAGTFDTLVRQLQTELDRQLRAAPNADGVVLACHGSMLYEDTEGPRFLPAEPELIRVIRGVVGPDLPVACLLDFHGNSATALAGRANVLVAHETNPHSDHVARGREAWELIRRARAAGAAVSARRVRLGVHDVHCLSRWAAAARLTAALRALEDGEWVWHAQWLAGASHASQGEPAVTVAVTGRPGPHLDRAARRAARLVREAVRELLALELADPATSAAAAREALRSAPVAVCFDIGDNPGAGAGGHRLADLGRFAAALGAARRAEGSPPHHPPLSLSAGVVTRPDLVASPPAPGARLEGPLAALGTVESVRAVAAGRVLLRLHGRNLVTHLAVADRPTPVAGWAAARRVLPEAAVWWLKATDLVDLPPEAAPVWVNTEGATGWGARALRD